MFRATCLVGISDHPATAAAVAASRAIGASTAARRRPKSCCASESTLLKLSLVCIIDVKLPSGRRKPAHAHRLVHDSFPTCKLLRTAHDRGAAQSLWNYHRFVSQSASDSASHGCARGGLSFSGPVHWGSLCALQRFQIASGIWERAQTHPCELPSSC